jgi:hypothetical protein
MIRHLLLRWDLMSRPTRRRSRARRHRGLEQFEERVLLSANPTTYTVNLLSDTGTGTGNSGDLAYVVNLANANTNPAGSLIEFDPTVFGMFRTIALNSTLELSETSGPEVIEGPATSKVVIDGNGTVGDFQVDTGMTAALSQLVVDNGSTGSDGGGIANLSPSQLAIFNSTLAGNFALNGGGIENEGLMKAVNVTIAYNEASAGDANAHGSGGGLYNDGGTATLDNTIVALNVNEFTSPATEDDIPLPVDSASAFNLIGTGGFGGLTSGSNGNLVGVVNPELGMLANNGGPVPTIALNAGSPAIDKGSNALAVDPASGQSLMTDGRGPGFVRISGGTVDIGAYELGGGSPRIVNAHVLHRTVNVGRPHNGRVKTRSQFVGFELAFSRALDAATAQNASNYSVLATTGRGRKTASKRVRFNVSYNPTSFAVDLVLQGKQAFPKGGMLSVNMGPRGITDPSGDSLVGTTLFTILPNASGLD